MGRKATGQRGVSRSYTEREAVRQLADIVCYHICNVNLSI